MENGDVYVALGSNLGDSAETLLKAWSLLGEHDDITLTALSPPFLTAPVEMTSAHRFVNAVGRLSTRLTPHALLDTLFDTESVFGRARKVGTGGYQDRTLDLDLLYFGSAIQNDPKLTLPHPKRCERLFVLAPMATISPGFVDPERLQTIAEMHLQLLEKMKNNQTVSQEITASSWPA